MILSLSLSAEKKDSNIYLPFFEWSCFLTKTRVRVRVTLTLTLLAFISS